MIYLSNVIKSVTLVDQFDNNDGGQLSPLILGRVIKRSDVCQPQVPVSTDFRLFAPKVAYLNEINRLKIEIEDAKNQLRSLRGEIENPLQQPAEEPGRPFEENCENVDKEAIEQRIQKLRAAENEALERARAAEEAALRLTGDAEKDAEQLRQQAKNEGYLEGFNKGYEESLDEFKSRNEPMAEKLAFLVEQLSEFEQMRLRNSEQELVDLSVGVAARIVAGELETNPKAIVKMIRETVTQNHSEEYIRITLSDELMPVELEASAEMRQLLEQLGANVTVMTDTKAGTGTIKLETPKGIIDMSVDTQLENVREILREEVV